MCIPAIATIILNPLAKSIDVVKGANVFFSSSSIVHLSRSNKPLGRNTPKIEASSTPRSFTFDYREAFVLVLDSGTDVTHRLYIVLFQPSQRERVIAAMADWRSWKPNSSKSGAHWYRPSILKRFTGELEYYLDSEGEPTGLAGQPMSWTESGLSSIFKTQKTRLGTRRTAACLDQSLVPTVNLAQATDRGDEESEESAIMSKIKHEKSNANDEDSGEDHDWIGDGTIQQRIKSLVKVVPSARLLFSPMSGVTDSHSNH